MSAYTKEFRLYPKAPWSHWTILNKGVHNQILFFEGSLQLQSGEIIRTGQDWYKEISEKAVVETEMTDIVSLN